MEITEKLWPIEQLIQKSVDYRSNMSKEETNGVDDYSRIIMQTLTINEMVLRSVQLTEILEAANRAENVKPDNLGGGKPEGETNNTGARRKQETFERRDGETGEEDGREEPQPPDEPSIPPCINYTAKKKVLIYGDQSARKWASTLRFLLDASQFGIMGTVITGSNIGTIATNMWDAVGSVSRQDHLVISLNLDYYATVEILGLAILITTGEHTNFVICFRSTNPETLEFFRNYIYKFNQSHGVNIFVISNPKYEMTTEYCYSRFALCEMIAEFVTEMDMYDTARERSDFETVRRQNARQPPIDEIIRRREIERRCEAAQTRHRTRQEQEVAEILAGITRIQLEQNGQITTDHPDSRAQALYERIAAQLEQNGQIETNYPNSLPHALYERNAAAQLEHSGHIEMDHPNSRAQALYERIAAQLEQNGQFETNYPNSLPHALYERNAAAQLEHSGQIETDHPNSRAQALYERIAAQLEQNGQFETNYPNSLPHALYERNAAAQLEHRGQIETDHPNSSTQDLYERIAVEQLQEIGQIETNNPYSLAHALYKRNVAAQLEQSGQIETNHPNLRAPSLYECPAIAQLQESGQIETDRLNSRTQAFYESGQIETDRLNPRAPALYERLAAAQLQEIGQIETGQLNSRTQALYESGQIETNRLNPRAPALYERLAAAQLQEIGQIETDQLNSRTQALYESGQIETDQPGSIKQAVNGRVATAQLEESEQTTTDKPDTSAQAVDERISTAQLEESEESERSMTDEPCSSTQAVGEPSESSSFEDDVEEGFEGVLIRKHERESRKTPSKNRSWNKVYCVLKGAQLSFYKDKKTAKSKPNQRYKGEGPLTLQNAVAEEAPSSTNMTYIFRLKLRGGGRFLFQAEDEIEMKTWVSFINYYADNDYSEP